MLLEPLSGLLSAEAAAARQIIAVALAEDVGTGDVTSQAVIPVGIYFRGSIVARHDMVVAGLPIAAKVFQIVAPETTFTARVSEGQRIVAGTILAEINGPAQGLLAAERTALNLLQNLSGVATETRAYVERLAGTGVTLLDTRKTIPGLRRLAKYATRVGGACNHRFGLYDGVLIKDNHIAVCGSIQRAVQSAREYKKEKQIEVECDSIEQVREAVESEVDIILLDNMPLETLRLAVDLIAGRAKTEASGSVTLDSIRAIAATGVDYISVGRITHSAPAVDIGLDWHAV
ncbi:Quinolinate phosphoribosyltransferase [decarboxylating] [invertebrate metagenome]|uniref:Probable nicotinate-nucleotide pyrophosphorylase [carboxylating] n=1 Tax=invertebrate metagenome TaxID=1711999 RepID=A0A484H634_9ZZZZ